MAPAASAASQVRAVAARLRLSGEALRDRPRAARVAVLGALLERLRDPNSEISRRLLGELPGATGFHPATIAAGLSVGFAGWTARALAELADRELGADPRHLALGFPLTSVVLGGALPMPTVLQLIAPLLLGSPVLVRPGAHDPVTSRAVAVELARLDERLGASIEVVSFPHEDANALAALCEAECVVATGSDPAVAAVRSRTQPWQRFVGYGHRFSVAALGREGDLRASCAGLAQDVFLWDQLGCLSPVALYAIGWSWEQRGRLLDEMENAFSKKNAAWPRGVTPAEEAAIRSHEIATCELRAGAGAGADLRVDPLRGWALLAEREPEFRGSPLFRVLRVHFVSDLHAMTSSLAPAAHQLASVGVAGLSLAASSDLSQQLAALGASRVCPLGRMQAPPLAWSHDGQGVLAPLARRTDLELEAR